MPVQVNTLVSEETWTTSPQFMNSASPGRRPLEPVLPISVGRGKVLQPLTPERGEQMMGWIYETSKVAPFIVATTEAPSYRRVALNKMREEGLTGEQIKMSAGIADSECAMETASCLSRTPGTSGRPDFCR